MDRRFPGATRRQRLFEIALFFAGFRTSSIWLPVAAHAAYNLPVQLLAGRSA